MEFPVAIFLRYEIKMNAPKEETQRVQQVLLARRGSFLLLCPENPKFPECLRPAVCLLLSIAKIVLLSSSALSFPSYRP